MKNNDNRSRINLAMTDPTLSRASPEVALETFLEKIQHGKRLKCETITSCVTSSFCGPRTALEVLQHSQNNIPSFKFRRVIRLTPMPARHDFPGCHGDVATFKSVAGATRERREQVTGIKFYFTDGEEHNELLKGSRTWGASKQLLSSLLSRTWTSC